METQPITFEWITDPKHLTDHLDDVRRLMAQLSDCPPEQVDVATLSIISMNICEKSYVCAIRDGERIIGLATLAPIYRFNGFKGHIEDVIVDESYRGQGLGRKLIEHLLEKARSLHMTQVTLTSDPANPKRAAARDLYAKLGFVERAGLFKYQV